MVSERRCSVGVAAQGRPRARDLGHRARRRRRPGALNAITDVAGVRVGHDDARRRAIACEPVSRRSSRTAATCSAKRCPAPSSSATRSASSPGRTQVEELGTIETPIVLTNTLSVGAALDGVARWTLAQPGNENVRSVNGLVGETNDGGAERHPRVSRSPRITSRRRSPARQTAPSPKAPSAPAPARLRSAGKAASARRRAVGTDATGRWACSCRPTTAGS